MPYLRETLASVEAQTYKNQEILVWDDCSTDGSLEELQRWIPGQIPGRIFSGKSEPLGSALGFLVEQADTELCARIDGDDVNLPLRLEQQVAFMQSHPEVGVLGGQIDMIDEDGQFQHTDTWWKYPTDDATLRWRTRWQSGLCHPSVMLRKAAVMAAGNYRKIQSSEDTDLWLRMSHTAEIRNLRETVLKYRRSSTSATGQVVEFISLERQAAQLNASVLFPGIGDPARAMDLWEASHPYYLHHPSKLRHIFEIKKAAVNLAKKLGKPTGYFTSTALFQEQQDSLKKRFYKRTGLLPLFRLRQRLSAVHNR